MQISDSYRQNIRRLREERGLSQRALSELVGKSEGYVKEIEAGKSNDPGFHGIVSTAEALNCTLKDIFPDIPQSVINYSEAPNIDTQQFLDPDLLALAISMFMEVSQALDRTYPPETMAAAVAELYQRLANETEPVERQEKAHGLVMESLVEVLSPK